MASDADKTPLTTLGPMDQLLLDMSIIKAEQGKVLAGLGSLDAIERHVERTANIQLKMHAYQQREGTRTRLAIGTCVSCALICMVCTLVTYTKLASAAVSLERLERLPAAVHP